MSNEYKDWCWDAAQYTILDNDLIAHSEYCSDFNGGYIVAGTTSEGLKRIFFVWLDDDYGWSYKEIII